MGLDITAYQKLTLRRACTVAEANAGQRDDEEHDNVVLLYDGERRGDGLKDGFYERAGQEYGFRAGSYSGYNRWRGQLAELMLGKTDRQVWGDPQLQGPFVELINFSDCEGFIGPQTSAKLARDFAEHQAKADAFSSEDVVEADYFRRAYSHWRKAFELAAGEGAVKFH